MRAIQQYTLCTFLAQYCCDLDFFVPPVEKIPGSAPEFIQPACLFRARTEMRALLPWLMAPCQSLQTSAIGSIVICIRYTDAPYSDTGLGHVLKGRCIPIPYLCHRLPLSIPPNICNKQHCCWHSAHRYLHSHTGLGNKPRLLKQEQRKLEN